MYCNFFNETESLSFSSAIRQGFGCLPLVLPPQAVIVFDRWEGGTADLSISGTLALVLLSILHLIDYSVTLPHQGWKLRLSTWAMLYVINHWLEGAKKCRSDGSDLSFLDKAVKVIAVQTLNCTNIYTVSENGGTWGPLLWNLKSWHERSSLQKIIDFNSSCPVLWQRTIQLNNAGALISQYGWVDT